MITIAVYTDREILALGLAQVISPKYHAEVTRLDNLAGSLNGSAHLLSRGGRIPEAVILDAAPEAAKIVQRLRSEDSGVPLAVWERAEATEPALSALLLGVQGVLLDTSTPDDVMACLETILGGGIWVPPTVARAAILSRQCNLTKREGELMTLIASGLSNKEMAYTLGIGVGTVKVYLSRVFRKLGVSDRYGLALLVLRHMGAGSGEGNLANGQPPSCPRSLFVPRRLTDQGNYGVPAR